MADNDWKSDFRGRNREGLQANGVITRKKVFGDNHHSMIPLRRNDPSNGIFRGAKSTLVMIINGDTNFNLHGVSWNHGIAGIAKALQ